MWTRMLQRFDWSMSRFIQSLVNWMYVDISHGVLKIVRAEMSLMDWSAGRWVSVVDRLVAVGR